MQLSEAPVQDGFGLVLGHIAENAVPAGSLTSIPDWGEMQLMAAYLGCRCRCSGFAPKLI